ncbi:MAG: YbjN domain-containing protein [Rhodospirillaceae bacterium]|nr:YbjN domain-containing protein [Rhodospirillaceae bacterium]
MQTSDSLFDVETLHPIELIEQVLSARDWTFERRGDDELAVEIPGRWCDYGVFFALATELETLHISCSLDMRVPEPRRSAVAELLALANEKLWIGHFALWAEEGLPMFRYSLLLGAELTLGADRLESLIDVAISECERFYPAFQYVIWGGKNPAEAVEAAMLDTVGEA